MRSRASRSVVLSAGAALSAVGLVLAHGCGRDESGSGREARERRASQVAAAWDGSAAASEWRSGFHPMGDMVQLPKGGPRSKADARAVRERGFVLEGRLPAARPQDGRVAWDGGESLARPLAGAHESFETLTGARVGGKPHLTVTGAKLGEMTVATSRGPAVVPAWLFRLKGYDSPLKRAAVAPSTLPQPPIEQAREDPGHLDRLVEVSPDGRSVTVVALRGACDGDSVVEVLETRGSVVLSATVEDPQNGGDCTAQLLSQQVTVTLKRPVGDRVLLDAHTGRPVAYKPSPGPSPSWS
ncbi:hypothetical protein [Streptomyces sp. NPDC020141]|uniref:hypothetical protein n=1 Tax=Streptomyces sp. NPDC020141 TaxID=3365065 RepID=UPI00378FBA24